MIQEKAIRANLRIDSRESGHLRDGVGIVQKVFSPKGVPRIFDAFLMQF